MIFPCTEPRKTLHVRNLANLKQVDEANDPLQGILFPRSIPAQCILRMPKGARCMPRSGASREASMILVGCMQVVFIWLNRACIGFACGAVPRQTCMFIHQAARKSRVSYSRARSFTHPHKVQKQVSLVWLRATQPPVRRPTAHTFNCSTKLQSLLPDPIQTW